jgi:hypothetical protein
MSKYLKATLEDVNKLQATTGFFVPDDATAMTALAAIKAASNAKIIKAELQTPIALQFLLSNNAIAANIETCRAKAHIRFRGADTGSTARPFAYVTVSIPAPKGTLINGLTGDTSNADADGLKSHVLSSTGVTMTVVEKIWYGRAR